MACLNMATINKKGKSRDYWLQVTDSAGTLNLNVYEYNVQPNAVFNYEEGTSQIDRTMKARE